MRVVFRDLFLVPIIALAALVLSPGCHHDRAGPRGASGTLTLLHTNDFHGRLVPFRVEQENATAQTGDPGRSPAAFERTGYVGGFSRLSTVVNRIREERGAERVLLLHGGDTFSDDLLGNLTEGEAMIRAMNELGFQFLALGNHDFDYGWERTEELQALADFPMRAANVSDERTDESFLGDSTLVINAGDVRVGLLALGYTNTPLTGSPENVRGLSFDSGIEAARRHVPALRERADLVVVLSHLGTQGDEVLARDVEGIDAIIGAHSHDPLVPPERVDGVWIAQALSDAAMLGELQIEVEAGRIVSMQGKAHVLWNDEVPADPAIDSLIATLREPHRARLEQQVGTTAAPIGRNYRSESPFDKWVGRILRQETGATIAMLPGVGYGVTLPRGAVTREQLVAMLPHPSRLVTLSLTGAQVEEILEQSAANQAPDDPMEKVGGLIQTDGLRWTVDLTRPIGERVGDVRIGEEPLAPEGSYLVATHSGMLAGLHRYSTFARGRDIQEHDTRITDLVEAYLGRAGEAQPPPLGDVTLAFGPGAAIRDRRRCSLPSCAAALR